MFVVPVDNPVALLVITFWAVGEGMEATVWAEDNQSILLMVPPAGLVITVAVIGAILPIEIVGAVVEREAVQVAQGPQSTG